MHVTYLYIIIPLLYNTKLAEIFQMEDILGPIKTYKTAKLGI